ncbi:protease [Pedobacter sp. Leaf170]|uniref:protease n=1 Tax=Pedobacter sp. Leaf170 TaxID=2876558 RepID=UPI001E47E534|nr:protease [Pedobacter sp. Leaf170]
MKNLKLIIPAIAVLFGACSQNQTNNNKNVVADTTSKVSSDSIQSDSLFAKMYINETAKKGSPVLLKFTVINSADSAKSFCKWHTAFEPFISKYLDITDSNGNEVAYIGAMAKRIVPPPADSYLSVKAKDSISAEVDLLKAYDLKSGNKYYVSYNGSNISGVSAPKKLSFSFEE